MGVPLDIRVDQKGLVRWLTGLSATFLVSVFFAETVSAGQLIGRVLDADNRSPLPCRLYLEDSNGTSFTVSSLSEEGSAVVYEVERGKGKEIHTTLSAHPFTVELAAGTYSLIVERGKEYTPSSRLIEVSGAKTEVTMALNRWINMQEQGWYSGDTHVHRPLKDLPNLILAEDLNVALPLTYWVREFRDKPLGDQGPNPAPHPSADLIEVDSNHVIWPINTEYEIFTVDKKQHTLGAVFVLNHQKPFDLLAHPVRAVAEEARRQGAILDLDKHNWPWSMMLLPLMDVDLYELTNNHVWRSEFTYSSWYPDYLPAYLGLSGTDTEYPEDTWIRWGFGNYYALLNCGFDIKPSGGTASGVHPVPLGFGRVYVYLGEHFDFDQWMSGLERGRSFVTTGPMLDVRFNDHLPGTRFTGRPNESVSIRVAGLASSDQPILGVEVIHNGELVETFSPDRASLNKNKVSFMLNLEVEESSWVAVRCFSEAENGRYRFAHSGPSHITIPGRPLRPRREEATYLVKRVEDEILRHQGTLPESAIREYREALDFYQAKLKIAR